MSHSTGARDARFVPLALFGVTLVFHLLTTRGYGYFRDELYYLDNGEHLAFGYVEHPAFIGIVAALVRSVLGTSLFAIRLTPALAGAATVALTALSARELGGGRFAQTLAGLGTMFAMYTCVDCMPYENDKLIWIVRGPRMPMKDLWPRVRMFI